MQFRDYQYQAIAAALGSFENNDRVLISAPTGCGKTVIGAGIIDQWMNHNVADSFNLPRKVLWIAHRDELISQAVEKLRDITGHEVGVEMGKSTVALDGGLFHEDIVVASVQTLQNDHRRALFSPSDFGLVCRDECHHIVCEQDTKVLNYFLGNKLLGLTATPERADQISLGKVFQDVPFHMDLLDAIQAGWCARIIQDTIEVEELDFSKVRLDSNGDLSAVELDAIITQEKPLHHIAAAVTQLAGDRPTIIFTPSVDSAEMLAALMRDRYVKTGAVAVSGKTPDIERNRSVQAYLNGDCQFFVNCMLMTEGWDAPRTSCIVIARPTRSINLLYQMVGRGLRGGPRAPVPGKSNCLVLDLIGCAENMKLAHSVDILGGKYHEVVKEAAVASCREKNERGEPSDVVSELMKAVANSDELQRIQRQKIIAEAKLKRKNVDPFAILDVPSRVEPGWLESMPISTMQSEELKKNGIVPTALTQTEATQLLREVRRRRDAGECSPKQARILASYGYNVHVPFETASKIIDGIASRGWKHTKSEAINTRRRKFGKK